MKDFPKARVSRLSSLSKIALFLCCMLGPTGLRAQTISGTVQDPSGAVIAGAAIEITGGDLAQPIVLASDGLGKFNSPDLKPGTYSVRVTREGFEPLIKVVNLQGAVELQLTLAIAKRQEIISVPGRSLAFANTDP
ncbi:MAG: carboxypeptidase-like regulatory domain-containing protein, partial [Candidatus Sulfotelmatobacter sp.]